MKICLRVRRFIFILNWLCYCMEYREFVVFFRIIVVWMNKHKPLEISKSNLDNTYDFFLWGPFY